MRYIAAVLLLAAVTAPLSAGELPDFSKVKIDGVLHSAVGVTRRDTPIDVFVSVQEEQEHGKTRIAIVGGTDGDRRSVDAALEVLRWFYTSDEAAKYRKEFTLAVIPCGNPDGLLLDKGDENGQGGRPSERETGAKRYQSQRDVEAQYIDAWLEQHGADIYVYELRVARSEGKRTQLIVEDGKGSLPLATIFERIVQLDTKGSSPGDELRRRRIEQKDADFVAAQLRNYGHAPRSFAYFDTLPLKAMARLESLGIRTEPPKFSWGDRLPKSGSELSGMLYLLEPPYAAEHRAVLEQAAATAFDKDGKPLRNPPFYSQMSDAVFMNGPLLSGVGKLTGEAKYFDAAALHQSAIRKDCKREDSLYRHSPLCDAAWGRGNGFVAMGHALMLEDWPADHPDRELLLKEYQSHMAVLLKHQDYSGTWHQVIDHPESYREFTCTCMIGFAMARGVRAGWLDEKEYGPAIERAWRALKARTSEKGEFVDVCTGTGKQKTLRDYYDREALQGRDGRGASMLLMFASEMLLRK